MNNSEIARIREQIELECIAMHRLMNAPSKVATHEVISNRFKALDRLTLKMEEAVGSQEIAVSIAVDIYNATFDSK